ERLQTLRKETRCGGLSPATTDTLLTTRDGRPVILQLRYVGGGGLTLVADAGYFRNRAWRESDVPQLLVPLLTPRRRGRVSWDEYHHGNGEDVSLTAAVIRWLRGTPLGWALLQLAALALVGLATLAVRFGPARGVIERRRRSPLEHLEALAAGLESAVGGGVDTAVALTVGGLRRRHRQDAARPHSGARAQRQVPTHPVHPRPDAGGYHRHFDADRHAGVPVPAGADLRGSGARRRDQPRASQDPGGAARGDAGAHGHRRRRVASALGDVHRVRDAEPDRVRGHLPAPRGGARSLHDQGPVRLSARRSGAGDPHPLCRGLRGGPAGDVRRLPRDRR